MPSCIDGIVIVVLVLDSELPQKSCQLGVFWRSSKNQGKVRQVLVFYLECRKPLQSKRARIIDILALPDHNWNTVVTALILFGIRCQNSLYSTTLVGIPSIKHLYNRFRQFPKLDLIRKVNPSSGRISEEVLKSGVHTAFFGTRIIPCLAS
jgi:hypothetical protein